MRRSVVLTFVLLLLVLSQSSLYAEGPPDLAVGTGMWLRFHHGPSTFALTPGAAIAASYQVLPQLEVEAKLFSGAFFGYATGLAANVGYAPRIGPWLPAIGLSLQGVFGSNVFYYHAGTEWVEVTYPQWGGAIYLKPLHFSFGKFGISAFEVSVGTDLRAFADVLLVDVDLFRVVLYL